jgi:hypothetical protein
LVHRSRPQPRLLHEEATINENNAYVIEWFQQHYRELHGEMSSEQQQWEEEMTDFSHED